MGFSIKLNTIQEVQDFIKAAIRTNGEVMVKQRNYLVNGKSVLGILSLDLMDYVIVLVSTNDYSEFDSFIKK